VQGFVFVAYGAVTTLPSFLPVLGDPTFGERLGQRADTDVLNRKAAVFSRQIKLEPFPAASVDSKARLLADPGWP
jgi:hypothetical protein